MRSIQLCNLLWYQSKTKGNKFQFSPKTPPLFNLEKPWLPLPPPFSPQMIPTTPLSALMLLPKPL